MSDFELKCTKIQFRLGLRSIPRWGSLQRSPNTITGCKGPTSKGRGREGKERRGGEGREEDWREGKGREVLWSPKSAIGVVGVSHCDLDILTFNLECAVTININKSIDRTTLVYCEIARYLQNIPNNFYLETYNELNEGLLNVFLANVTV